MAAERVHAEPARVYAARWVLPVASPPVPHGAVAVDGAGRIAYVGPRAAAPPGPVTDLGDAALLPGLINAHARLDRTREDGGERAAARAAARAGLALGVTTVATAAATPAPLAALCALGARGVVYQTVAGPDPAEHDAALAGLRAHVAALRARAAALSASDRVHVGVGPRAVHAVHEDLLLDACAWAVGEKLPVAMPAGASADEIAFLREAAGPHADALRARGVAVVRRAYSPVHLLAELGITAVARPLLVHATHFDESDVALAAHYGCPVAHCPANDAAQRVVAPIRALLDAGVRVGLGTAPAAGDDTLDVLAAARVAALAQRAALGRADALTAREALHLATLGGARALGLDHAIGSLEPGKQADLCAFAVDEPDADPVDALVSTRAGRPTLLTVVQGRELSRHGRVMDKDPATETV